MMSREAEFAATNTTAGALDLCTVEGVHNATRVQGILATAGAVLCHAAVLERLLTVKLCCQQADSTECLPCRLAC